MNVSKNAKDKMRNLARKNSDFQTTQNQIDSTVSVTPTSYAT